MTTVTQSRRFSTASFAFALLALASLTGCRIAPPPNIKPLAPNAVSLDPRDWNMLYSSDMPGHPSAEAAASWSFGFPRGGHVNYVQTPFNATVALHNIEVTFRIDSFQAQYTVTDSRDKPPATVHLFFEQQNGRSQKPRWMLVGFRQRI